MLPLKQKKRVVEPVSEKLLLGVFVEDMVVEVVVTVLEVRAVVLRKGSAT